MTNPQEAPQEPSVWARPGSTSSAAQPAAPAEPPTTEIPPAYADGTGEPPDRLTIPPTAQPYSAVPPYARLPSQVMPASQKTGHRFIRRLIGDPLSITLILVIVLALLGIGLIGAELYVRKRVGDAVAAAVECEVKDTATVSLGPTPFLWQHLTGHYTGISIHTAGNQIRGGKGMKADITVNDVDLHGNAKSKGTIGALDATVAWTSDGIKETVGDAVPVVGGLIDSIKTDPSADTIRLSGPLGLGSITLKPRSTGGKLGLEVVKINAMGAPLPRESVQTALDVFTSRLTKAYPLGVRADSVYVTDDGVLGHFSARNAAIPASKCLAHI